VCAEGGSLLQSREVIGGTTLIRGGDDGGVASVADQASNWSVGSGRDMDGFHRIVRPAEQQGDVGPGTVISQQSRNVKEAYHWDLNG